MCATLSDQPLRRLDAAFGRVRRLWESPAVRREFLRRLGRAGGAGQPVEATLVGTLRGVRETPECGVRDLAERLSVDASTASRLVDAAVAGGFLSRTTSPCDRRRSLLALTARGETLLDRALAVREGILRELTYDWPAADVVRLAELLDRLADRLTERESAST